MVINDAVIRFAKEDGQTDGQAKYYRTLLTGAYLCVCKIRMCVQLDAASIGFTVTAKPVLSGQSKKTKINLNDKWQLNEGRKYCRMLPLEHSAILLTLVFFEPAA